MTIKLPALIPDRNSASGFRVEYLGVTIDPDVSQVLAEYDQAPEAKRMRKLAQEIRQADLQRLAQLTWSDKDLIIKALSIAAATIGEA